MIGGRAGPYVLIAELGRGAFGAVYRARHGESRVEHAVKVLHHDLAFDPEDIVRFRREAEMLARLDRHPNIVSVHAVGEDDVGSWMAMDLVRGRPLQTELAGGPLPIARAVDLLIPIARAVAHAHERGVVHRDLKPENVLMDERGVPRVVDFGLAFDDTRTRLSKTGEVMGTPSFMAPEVVLGWTSGSVARIEASAVDPRADVYGLGATLYVLLTGRAPHQGKTAHETLLRVTEGMPEAPRQLRPELPLDLERIVLGALERDPARRYPTATAFADDLERWRVGEAVAGAAPARRARRLVVATLVVTAVGAAAALAFGWGSIGAGPPGPSRLEQQLAELDRQWEAASRGSADALARAGSIASELLASEELRGERRARLRRVLSVAESLVDDGRTEPDDDPFGPRTARAVASILLETGQLTRFAKVAPLEALLAWIADGGRVDDVSDDGLAEMATAVAARIADEPALEAALAGLLRRRVARIVEADDPADDARVIPMAEQLAPLVGQLGFDAASAPSADAIERYGRRRVEAEAAGPRALRLAIASLVHDPLDPSWVGRHLELGGLLHTGEGATLEERPAFLRAAVIQIASGQRSVDDKMLALYTGSPEANEIFGELAAGDEPGHLAVAVAAAISDEVSAEVAATDPAARLVAHWAPVSAILARERERSDVPAAILAWLAVTFADAAAGDQIPSASEDEHGDGPRGELRRRLLAAWPVGHDGSVRGRVSAVIDELLARARTRQGEGSAWDLGVPYAVLRWWCVYREEAPDAEEAYALALGTLERVAVLRETVAVDHWSAGIRLQRRFLNRTIDYAVGYVMAWFFRRCVFEGPCPNRRRFEALAGAIRRIKPNAHEPSSGAAVHAFIHGDGATAAAALAEAVGLDHEYRPIRAAIAAAGILIDRDEREAARRLLARTVDPDEPAFIPGHGADWRDRAGLWRSLGDEERAVADDEAYETWRARGERD